MLGVRYRNTGLHQLRREPGHTPPEHFDTRGGTRWQYTARRSESRELSRLSPTHWIRLCSNGREQRNSARLVSRLRLQCKALPEISGIFPQIEATFACDLGQERSFFPSRRSRGISERLASRQVQFLDTGHFAIETHVVKLLPKLHQAFPLAAE